MNLNSFSNNSLFIQNILGKLLLNVNIYFLLIIIYYFIFFFFFNNDIINIFIIQNDIYLYKNIYLLNINEIFLYKYGIILILILFHSFLLILLIYSFLNINLFIFKKLYINNIKSFFKLSNIFLFLSYYYIIDFIFNNLKKDLILFFKNITYLKNNNMSLNLININYFMNIKDILIIFIFFLLLKFITLFLIISLDKKRNFFYIFILTAILLISPPEYNLQLNTLYYIIIIFESFIYMKILKNIIINYVYIRIK